MSPMGVPTANVCGDASGLKLSKRGQRFRSGKTGQKADRRLAPCSEIWHLRSAVKLARKPTI